MCVSDSESDSLVSGTYVGELKAQSSSIQRRVLLAAMDNEVSVLTRAPFVIPQPDLQRQVLAVLHAARGRNELALLLAPSGHGKSTFLAGGALSAADGRVAVGDGSGRLYALELVGV